MVKAHKVIENGRVVKAGGIVFKQENNQRVFLLIYRGNHQDYSFPKGHVEKGETPEECAIREFYEETGLLTSVVKTLTPELYENSKNGEKTILYMYLMKITGGELKVENPCDKLIWADEDQVQRLVHPNLRKYFQEILEGGNL